MELYTLHLHSPLRYTRLIAPSADALLADSDGAAEGSESLAIWDIDTLVLSGDDGPRLREPLPAPFWAGSASAGLQTPGPESNLDTAGQRGLSPDAEAFTLERGSYLFCQARAIGAAEMRELMEWFLRESWWSGARIADRLYLRLVREDGKTAVQALARNTKL